MSDKDKVIEAFKNSEEPLNATKVSEISGVEKKEVDKIMKELKKDETIVSYTFTSDGDGTFIVSSSDATVATASIDGKTITLTPLKVGTSTITVTHTEKTTGGNYTTESETFELKLNAIVCVEMFLQVKKLL